MSQVLCTDVCICPFLGIIEQDTFVKVKRNAKDNKCQTREIGPALTRIFGLFAIYILCHSTPFCLCYLSSNSVVPLRDIPSSTRVLLDNLKKRKIMSRIL